MKKHLVIVCANQMIFISKIIQKCLKKKAKVTIIDNATFHADFATYKDADLFLVYCIFMMHSGLLPYIHKKLIIYQLEQHVNGTISRHYSNMIQDGTLFAFYNASILQLEYCRQNQDVVQQAFQMKTKLLPIPIDAIRPMSSFTTSKKIDILFIGLMNERRHRILQSLKNMFSIHCITQSIFDTALIPYFDQCKILLNIHYYENAILERVRINEGLHHSMLVVSEKPNSLDEESMSYYDDMVVFVDSENQLAETIREQLKKYDFQTLYSHLQEKLDNHKRHFKGELNNMLRDHIKDCPLSSCYNTL